MARAQTYEAIVLRSFDIGEADRFCILFTRQRGRVAARARGVRKMQSRMGGSLLPFSHARLELVETDHSMTITSASSIGNHTLDYGEYEVFARLQRGAELVLALTEDEEPLRDVFELLLNFLHAATVPGCDASLPFALCLLQVLGLLPAREEDRRFALLPPEAKAFVRRRAQEQTIDVLCAELADPAPLRTFVHAVLEDHLKKPLASW